MPDYIPAPDYGKDISDAVQTYLGIKKVTSDIAIQQQLAQSHLQTAQLERQAQEMRNQVLGTQAQEFNSPQSVAARRTQQQQDVALGGQQLEHAQFENKINPLKEQGLNLQNQQYQISVAESKKRLDHLDTLLEDEQKTRETLNKTAEVALQQKGLDYRVAQQIAPMQAQKMQQQLQEGVLQAKQMQQQLEMGAKTLTNYDDLHKSQSIAQATEMLKGGVPPAAVAEAFPQQSAWISKIGSLTQRDPAKAIQEALYQHAMESGDEESLRAAAAQFAKPLSDAEIKADALKAQTATIMGTPYTPQTDNREKLYQALKLMQKNPGMRPKGSLFEDSGTTASPSVPPSVDSGSYPLQGPQIGSALTKALQTGTPVGPGPNTSGVVPSPQQVQRGKTSIQGSSAATQIGQEADNAFYGVDRAIKEHKDVADLPFKANSAPEHSTYIPMMGTLGKREGEATLSDSLVRSPFDPGYHVGDDGTVYDSTAYATKENKFRNEQQGKENQVTSSLPLESALKDEEFQKRIKKAFVADASATSAQEARYRAIIGQLARAFNEKGATGLNPLYVHAALRYPIGLNGITEEQGSSISSLVASYGQQRAAQSK